MLKHTLVLGVGNEYRSDDAVGIHFAQQLAKLALPNIQVMESFGEGVELMAMWENVERLIICDAVCTNSPPGTIHVLNPTNEEIPSQFFNYSTHAFSLAEAIEMSRALGTLPKEVIIYGISGGNFAAGIELSPLVATALEKVIIDVVNLLSKETTNA